MEWHTHLLIASSGEVYDKNSSNKARQELGLREVDNAAEVFPGMSKRFIESLANDGNEVRYLCGQLDGKLPEGSEWNKLEYDSVSRSIRRLVKNHT